MCSVEIQVLPGTESLNKTVISLIHITEDSTSELQFYGLIPGLIFPVAPTQSHSVSSVRLYDIDVQSGGKLGIGVLVAAPCSLVLF